MSELQKIIKKKEGKEQSLLLDVKTRWNSVLPMIRRYLEIKSHLKAALELFNDGQLFQSRYDDTLAELSAVLQPIEEAVVTLSKHSSNIMIAEVAIKFIYQKLNSINSSLAKDLAETVLTRYNQRRNEKDLSLLLFLETGAYPKSSFKFKYSPKKDILETAAAMLKQLFPDEEPTSQEQEGYGSDENMSLQDGIDKFTERVHQHQVRATVTEYLDKDIKMFEATGEKSQRLTKLHNALMSFQPTSTSCEQAFSVAGSFKTKVRNRMSPEKLRILLWLKYYFTKRQ